MSSVAYGENEVFSFYGHLEGELAGELKSGYAVAHSAEDAIRSMRECGFCISAITSLAEVKQTVAILELIAHRHPDIEPTDYVDVYPAEVRPYPESNVFCFTGYVVDLFSALKAGFIVATDVEFVVTYLKGFSFVVESVTSLEQLRQVMADMTAIASDDASFDQSCVVNFKTAA